MITQRRRLIFLASAAMLIAALPVQAGVVTPAGVATLADGNVQPGVATLADENVQPGVRAGVAKVDSTWHVGASAGQYASDGTSVGDHGVDYQAHQTRRAPSYGIQGREWVRALVVEGNNGQRFALIANDLYIPQDLVNRRVGQIIADYDKLNPSQATGITPENMTIAVSHSHSSPYYSTPSWGVWAFEDVFDIRYFEHIAQMMASSVIQAASNMVPARMGAAVSSFTKLKKHSYGPVNPAQSSEGSPAGYPKTDVDGDLTVLRFDDISSPESPKPLATWIVWGMHPENLDGNDLLTGEYVNTMYRILDRELGGVALFSQNDTGTAEADESQAHAVSERQEFSHREYAQMERAARTLSDAVKATHTDIERVSNSLQPVISNQSIPYSSDFPVGVKDLRFAPPSARVFPSASSCRTESAFNGNPGVPVAGLPDCEFAFGNGGRPPIPFDPGVTYDTLREAGVPIPDNTSAPSYTGLQETLQVHLQAVRLGSVGITICPCEQWADQSRNIKSRLNLTPDDLRFGWDWTANYTSPGWEPGVIYDGQPGNGPITLNDFCTQNLDNNWTCKNPSNPSVNGPTISDSAFRRMKAQIYNNAAGWDLVENSLRAESEPEDISQIWGNFTHEEYTANGYPIVVTVGMANDYWGYIASYREYQRGDHYRKALTGLGPHSSDFLATRLSKMAAELNGGPPVDLGPKDRAYAAEYEHQGLRARAIGETAQKYLPIYEAAMPPNGGTNAITTQPSDIERFAAARISWVGGDNYVDTPNVTVEHCYVVDPADCGTDDWKLFANGEGEVEIKANYPQPEDMAEVAQGSFEWSWDATFEAFGSDVALPDAQGIINTQTPTGLYRFVIEGCRKFDDIPVAADPKCSSYDATGRVRSYELTSNPFLVEAFDGITASNLRNDSGIVRFDVGPVYPFATTSSNTEKGPLDYPDTYASPFKFITPRNLTTSRREDLDRVGSGASEEIYCFQCSFRPWADTGAIAKATVTIEKASGGTVYVDASCNSAGACVLGPVTLVSGDQLTVARGGVIDDYVDPNFNGLPSNTLVI